MHVYTLVLEQRIRNNWLHQVNGSLALYYIYLKSFRLWVVKTVQQLGSVYILYPRQQKIVWRKMYATKFLLRYHKSLVVFFLQQEPFSHAVPVTALSIKCTDSGVCMCMSFVFVQKNAARKLDRKLTELGRDKTSSPLIRCGMFTK